MNYSDITVGIVSFKSEKVIFRCLKSIKKLKKIIIFDNSNDNKLKKKINLIYPKIKFILSKKNLGYGEANNKIIKICKTKFLFILNPDTILEKKCERELLDSIKYLKNNFAVISPLSKEKNYSINSFHIEKNINSLINVEYVKGFAMLVNIAQIKNIGMFDKKIFLYLEEIDLCNRLKDKNKKIYINKKAKIIHLGAKSTNLGFEFEKCRNWHWMWSSFYFYKKNNNYFLTALKFAPILLTNFLKFLFFSIVFNYKKKIIYYMRMTGIFNSMIGKSSWYRPKLN